MTIEEAKEIFLNRGYIQVKGGRIYDGDKWRESVVVISKWLEQEPCEDCISRKQAMKACYQMAVRTGIEEMPYRYAETELAHLPSIQPKTDALDKIKAEIKKESRFCPLTEGLERALEIIDKYTAERK